jgi:hypothetical protein
VIVVAGFMLFKLRNELTLSISPPIDFACLADI